MAFCVCLITAPQGEFGAKLARMLVEEKLAACVNLVPQIQSSYWWEGKINEDAETLLIVKTDKLKVKSIIKFVKSKHPYKVPEVISLRIKEGNRDYLRWIADSLGTPPRKERVPKGKAPKEAKA
jgi:periplasmic divalent cation tolerance protein